MNTDDLYRILRTGHAQAQGIVDTISDPLLVLDAGLCVQVASRAFFQTFGVDRYETIGRPLFDLGNGQWDVPELRRLLQEVLPKASAIIDFEVTHAFPDIGQRTMLLTARTLYQPDGGSHSILLTIVDRTEQQARDAAKDLLFGELRHRLRNLLGVIQALARQTTTQDRTAEEYRDDLLGRLDALIEAENIAFDGHPGTDLRTLIAHILAPYAERSHALAIDAGPQVDLSPRQVMSLALVFHELATNAAKYGALSAHDGQVRVSWTVSDAHDELSIEWSESGGPPVTPPTSSGFGSTLIRATVGYSLRGRLEQIFARDGFSALIVIPLGSAVT